MMRLRGQLHTILEDMDRYPNACLEKLEAFLTLWDVEPRLDSVVRNCGWIVHSNDQEEHDREAMFIWDKDCPRYEVIAMENDVEFKVKAQPLPHLILTFQELISYAELVPNTDWLWNVTLKVYLYTSRRNVTSSKPSRFAAEAIEMRSRVDVQK
ncbi:hypothetical protein Tco_0795204 [Tanacetum coccineum]